MANQNFKKFLSVLETKHYVGVIALVSSQKIPHFISVFRYRCEIFSWHWHSLL